MVGMIVFLAALGWFGALFVLSREAWGGIMPWAFLALLLICAFFVSFEEEWRARRLYRRTQLISQMAWKTADAEHYGLQKPYQKGEGSSCQSAIPHFGLSKRGKD
jgi:hypothetical protein